MRLRSVSRPVPRGLTAAFLATFVVAVANYAAGVYGGAIVAGLGGIVVVLLGVLS